MQDYTPTPDFYNDYIAHHGILGMSWGHRNGPPYPLGSDKSTGHRLKKGGEVRKKKKDDRNIKKAQRDFEKSHRLFKTEDGRSWYIRKDVTKDDKGRYQTTSIKTKNGLENYLIDTKRNVIVEKTTMDKNGNNINIARLSDADRGSDAIAKLKKKRDKQWNEDIKNKR